jgi:hypothetical protein
MLEDLMEWLRNAKSQLRWSRNGNGNHNGNGSEASHTSSGELTDVITYKRKTIAQSEEIVPGQTASYIIDAFGTTEFGIVYHVKKNDEKKGITYVLLTERGPLVAIHSKSDDNKSSVTKYILKTVRGDQLLYTSRKAPPLEGLQKLTDAEYAKVKELVEYEGKLLPFTVSTGSQIRLFLRTNFGYATRYPPPPEMPAAISAALPKNSSSVSSQQPSYSNSSSGPKRA